MFQGGGNIPLLMPIFARLVARGHHVRIMAGPGIRWSRLPLTQSLLDRVTSIGATLVPFKVPDKHPLDGADPIRGLIGQWCPQGFKSLPGEARTGDWSPAWAANVAEELHKSPADILVSDFVLRGSLAAAEAASIPTVALAHTVFIRPIHGIPPYGPGWLPAHGPISAARNALGRTIIHYLHRRDGLRQLNHARKSLGLPSLKSPFEQYDRTTRILMLMKRDFDFSSTRLPKNMRYLGTPIEDSGSEEWGGPWRSDDKRPLVLISLSTTNQGQKYLLQRIFDATKSIEDLRILVTLGPAMDASKFDIPSNIFVETFVRHSAVLPQASVLVCQCGIGVVTKSLINGVPILCIPILGDQPDNAARVVARGAGLRVDKEASPDVIGKAIRRLVTEPNYRNSAQSLGAKLNKTDPIESSVHEIEALIQ
jgi:MGT family glycosyltransferase